MGSGIDQELRALDDQHPRAGRGGSDGRAPSLMVPARMRVPESVGPGEAVPPGRGGSWGASIRLGGKTLSGPGSALQPAKAVPGRLLSGILSKGYPNAGGVF